MEQMVSFWAFWCQRWVRCGSEAEGPSFLYGGAFVWRDWTLDPFIV